MLLILLLLAKHSHRQLEIYLEQKKDTDAQQFTFE